MKFNVWNASGATHILVSIIAAIYGFLISPPGQQLVATYPKAAPIVMGIITILGMYLKPNSGSTDGPPAGLNSGAKVIIVALVLLGLGSAAHAQSAPTPLPGYNISIGAGYTSTSGNQTNNGMWASLAVPMYTFKGAWNKYDFNVAARGDYFTITSPQTYAVTAGPEIRAQFSKASLLGGVVFQPFSNLGFGFAESQCAASNSCAAGSDSTKHFAFKIGGGLDIPMNATLVMRLVELDYIKSTIFPGGGVGISNIAQISTGLKIQF